jgi:RNA polymerase sigma factor (sigma-70 family)
MTNKIPHPDQYYIEAIKKNDHKTIRSIYKQFSGKVVRHVCKNSGTREDALDIIQETLITVFQQANDENLTLTCPFEAYFFLLCKRKWLNKLKQKKGVTMDDSVLSIADDTLEHVKETELYDEKNRLFDEKFNELGEKCRELLTLSIQLQDMEAVARQLGVSYAYVRKRNPLCVGQLTELIRGSAIYKALKE